MRKYCIASIEINELKYGKINSLQFSTSIQIEITIAYNCETYDIASDTFHRFIKEAISHSLSLSHRIPSQSNMYLEIVEKICLK